METPCRTALAAALLPLLLLAEGTVWQDDFSGNTLTGWTVVDVGREAAPSRWTVGQGAARQTSNIYTRPWDGNREADWTGSFLVADDVTFSNGEAEAAIWSTDDDGVGLAWRYRGPGDLCKVQINASPPFWQVSRTVDGTYRCVASGPRGYTVGRMHRLRVRCEGSRTAVWLDDALLFAGDVDGPEAGGIALESRGNQGTHCDYVRITQPSPRWTDETFAELLAAHRLSAGRLQHLAVLPGQALTLELPAAVPAAHAAVRHGDTVLATAPLSSRVVRLWTNPGALTALGTVELRLGDRLVRTLPFNIRPALPEGIGVCAHRGDSAVAPENTLPAIRSAVEKGANQIEIDVTTTSDGHLILLHDLTLERTTDGTGRPAEHTLARIKQLDAGSWKDAKWAGARIPTLEEALAEIPRGIWVNLHLKAGIAAQVAETITRLDRTRWCFLACSRDEAVKARAVNPAILICNMSGQAGPDSSYARDTIEMGARFLQFYDARIADSLPRACHELKQHSIGVNFFPANDPAQFRRMLEAGVNYPLTDRLDTMLAVLRDMGAPPPPGL